MADAESQHHLRVLVAVAVVCMLAVTVVTALRIYTRHFLLHRLGVDDLLAVASWVSEDAPCSGPLYDGYLSSGLTPTFQLIFTGLTSLYLAHINYGLGRQFGDFASLAALTLSIKVHGSPVLPVLAEVADGVIALLR